MGDRAEHKRRVVPWFASDRCKRCGICTHMCPTVAIAPDDEGTPVIVDQDACTSCRLCEHLCPDFAISMVSPEDAQVRRDRDEADEHVDHHPAAAREVCHPFGACDG